MVVAGPFYAAALLLVVGGGQKVLEPTPLVRALTTLHLPVPALMVRIGAAAELGVGGSALLRGDRLSALLVAASYTIFTAVVVLALIRGGVLASCGCFGKHDVPPTRTHAVVTGSFALSATIALTGPPGALLGSPALLPLAVTTAAVAVCAYLVMAVLPLLETP